MVVSATYPPLVEFFISVLGSYVPRDQINRWAYEFARHFSKFNANGWLKTYTADDIGTRLQEIKPGLANDIYPVSRLYPPIVAWVQNHFWLKEVLTVLSVSSLATAFMMTIGQNFVAALLASYVSATLFLALLIACRLTNTLETPVYVSLALVLAIASASPLMLSAAPVSNLVFAAGLIPIVILYLLFMIATRQHQHYKKRAVFMAVYDATMSPHTIVNLKPTN